MKLLLLVDDQPVDAVGWILAVEGFDVRQTSSGRETFGLVRLLKPAAVILDVALPDMDGISVARLLREHWPTLPIVFTTGHEEDYAGLQAALADGPTRLLQKPYKVDTLIATLRAMTTEAQTRPA